MVLGGCGAVLIAILGAWLWSKHNKSLKPWGDANGMLALFCFLWVAVSILFWIVAFFIYLTQ